MTSSNAYASNKEYFLLDNLGHKHSLLMKFDQFISYYRRKKLIKTFYKNYSLKTSFRPFRVCKKLNTNSIGKLDF